MSDASQTGGKVLVLGGTGHIGAAIARCFAEDGYQVTAAGRQAAPRANLAGTSVAQVAGDDRDAADLNRWITGAALVVDAATPYPLWRHDSRAQRLVSDARRRMAMVMQACAAQGAALVHVSSFTTLPVQGGLQAQARIATIRGMHPYFEVKEAVERDVLAALRQGLKGCVVNPTACFGPYDLKPDAQTIIPMLAQGKVAGTLRHPVNVIDVRDVAACVLAAVQQGFRSRRLPLVGHNIHIDELTRHICALLGTAPPRVTAPLLPTVFASYWAETAAAMIGRKSRWPSLPMLLTAAGREMTPAPEQMALGVEIRPLAQTLRDAVAWYGARPAP